MSSSWVDVPKYLIKFRKLKLFTQLNIECEAFGLKFCWKSSSKIYHQNEDCEVSLNSTFCIVKQIGTDQQWNWIWLAQQKPEFLQGLMQKAVFDIGRRLTTNCCEKNINETLIIS